MARALAARTNARLLRSGLLYRWLGNAIVDPTFASEAEIREAVADIRAEPAENEIIYLVGGNPPGPALDSADVSARASQLAAVPLVRELLLPLQREAIRHGPIIAEGRDMGTVVFPAAQAKFFLDVSPQEAARRRARERGAPASQTVVLAELQERDARDRTRTVAPLAAAPDSVRVLTDNLSVDGIIDFMLKSLGSRGFVHTARPHGAA